MTDIDRDYYARRAEQEYRRAAGAASLAERLAHQRLAQLYQALLAAPATPAYRHRRIYPPHEH
jgi:hypothetical protein